MSSSCKFEYISTRASLLVSLIFWFSVTGFDSICSMILTPEYHASLHVALLWKSFVNVAQRSKLVLVRTVTQRMFGVETAVQKLRSLVQPRILRKILPVLFSDDVEQSLIEITLQRAVQDVHQFLTNTGIGQLSSHQERMLHADSELCSRQCRVFEDVNNDLVERSGKIRVALHFKDHHLGQNTSVLLGRWEQFVLSKHPSPCNIDDTHQQVFINRPIDQLDQQRQKDPSLVSQCGNAHSRKLQDLLQQLGGHFGLVVCLDCAWLCRVVVEMSVLTGNSNVIFHQLAQGSHDQWNQSILGIGPVLGKRPRQSNTSSDRVHAVEVLGNHVRVESKEILHFLRLFVLRRRNLGLDSSQNQAQHFLQRFLDIVVVGTNTLLQQFLEVLQVGNDPFRRFPLQCNAQNFKSVQTVSQHVACTEIGGNKEPFKERKLDRHFWPIVWRQQHVQDVQSSLT
ncbi:hypothetical protein OGAPHI_006101 [Ogataea philodendri]|uniref:Uncharacterized protein n=1 Tax=Ogataea philodendri TaxID=1378263 RepID=A0A9P8NYJ2_9ASCO|nr:uncharacterized protein OGAPHI_006101 [Ogataea philodendri]KAH3661922.1 hypothetical protein OGAPHI_006101 [Ogataea philodendri]